MTAWFVRSAFERMHWRCSDQAVPVMCSITRGHSLQGTHCSSNCLSTLPSPIRPTCSPDSIQEIDRQAETGIRCADHTPALAPVITDGKLIVLKLSLLWWTIRHLPPTVVDDPHHIQRFLIGLSRATRDERTRTAVFVASYTGAVRSNQEPSHTGD